MKKTLLLTLATLLLCITIVFGLTGCSFFTQEDIDNAVNEATAPLKENIASLEGQIAELNGQIAAIEDEKDTLEADKAALEADKAALEAELAEKKIELACLKGDHVWDGESEVRYSWSGGMTKCTVFFDCTYCEEEGSTESKSVTADEDGNIVAEFDGGFPSDTCVAPFVTGVTFNSDSEGYNEATNTFTVSEGNSIVITFTGKNLDMLNGEKNFEVCVKIEGNWYIFDYVYTPVYEGVSITIEEDKITYIWDYDFTTLALNGFGINQVEGFVLCDGDTFEMIMSSIIEVNLTVKQSDAPADEWVTVTTAEELAAAVVAGGNIRFGADIENENGFDLWVDTVIDLAGYDLKVTSDSQAAFWSLANSEITDSVGGSTLYNVIMVNSGTLKFSGDIKFEYWDFSIAGATNLDLSGYTGDELYIYATDLDDIILPDGYAFYNINGERLADLAAAKEVGRVYVRPDGGAPTEEWVTVTTAEELREAVAAGGNIRFGADIESETGFLLYNNTIIDLAGYDLKVTGASECTFWSYADSEVTDSVGGSILYNLITANSGTLNFSGAIQFEYSDYAINGSGNLDLSGYTGDKLYIYATYFDDVILPDGYAYYSKNGERLADLDAAKEVAFVYIRPDGNTPTDEWVTVTTAEELRAAVAVGGNIRLGASIDVGEEVFYIEKTTVLDLNSHILSTSFWTGIYIELNVTATVKNGTVQNLSDSCSAITSYGNLTVENCVLKGENYYALYICDNRAEVKNSTLDGGVYVSKNYAEYAELYAVDNVTVIPGECGIKVKYGTATFAFDPTDMLDEYYNEGVVTDNGDGTWTVIAI